MTERTRRIIDAVEAEDIDDDDDKDYVELPPAAEPAQVYSVRIPTGRLEELRKVAERKGVRPSSLMRQWVIDRLDEELSPRPVVEHVQVHMRVGPASVKAPGAMAAEIEEVLRRVPEYLREATYGS